MLERLNQAIKSIDFIPLNGAGGTLSVADAVGMTNSGSTITQSGALGISAVWRAVWVLSSTLAQLPLHVYHRIPSGKELAPDHAYYHLLHDQVNPRMTSFQWRLTTMAHAVTWGNGYSEKVRDGTGRVVELWPLRPDRMTVRLDPTPDGRGKLVYAYRRANGTVNEVDPERILHVRGLGYDGLIGYSVVTMARNSLGLTKAAEDYGSRTFKSNARPGLILTHPSRLSDPARDNLLNSVRDNYEGAANAGKTMLLEEGIVPTTIGFQPDDAQFLETRKFQVTEIARWFGVQPHRLFDLDRATFSNIEAQGIEWVQDFGAWTENFEQEFTAQLFEPDGDRDHFAEFNVDGLLRGDSAARVALYNGLWNMGSINPDEIRAKENLNPVPDGQGKAFYVPLNVKAVGAPTQDEMSRADQIDAAAALIKVGFEPEAALQTVGLGRIDHTGLEPVTLQDLGLPPQPAVAATNGHSNGGA